MSVRKRKADAEKERASNRRELKTRAQRLPPLRAKATEQPASLNAKGENVLPVIGFSQTQADAAMLPTSRPRLLRPRRFVRSLSDTLSL